MLLPFDVEGQCDDLVRFSFIIFLQTKQSNHTGDAMQHGTGRVALGQSQQHNILDASTLQRRKDVKKAREREKRQQTKEWYVTKELAALVDTAVGTFEGSGRKGLRIADKKVVALLALSGWKVDPETWTMVKKWWYRN
jgi:hypothetical protein